MSTELTQEDKNILDTFLDQLKQASIVGTEVSMQTLGNYVANSAPEQISHMSRMFKVYGYTGVFFAVKDSLTQGSSDPFLKYALGTLGYMIAAGTGCITGPAFLVAFGIGILVDGSWYLGEWVAENQDNIVEKLRELLEEQGMILDGHSISVSYPSSLKYNTIQIPDIKDLFSTGEETRSPLVVDLDGDGVETVGTNKKIFFDHDGNGFAESSGWVGKDDGLLVRNINGNGQIDDGTELFGNNSVLSSGEKAANGFEALKDLDSNNDGVFNNQDTAWAA